MYRILFKAKDRLLCIADETGKPLQFKTEDEALFFIQSYDLNERLQLVVLLERKGGDNACRGKRTKRSTS